MGIKRINEIVVTCDVCGKRIKKGQEYYKIVEENGTLKENGDIRNASFDEWLLCPSCYEQQHVFRFNQIAIAQEEGK